MNVELTGTVHAIMAEVEVTDNYKKKEVVVTIDENTSYPQQIICAAGNQKIDLLNGINHGDRVKISCNLTGKGNQQGKYFNNLQIWKVDKI